LIAPLLFLFAAAPVATTMAQPGLLDAGYRHMYNLSFDQAHQTFRAYQQQRPEDPMGPVSEAAAYLFAEFDRLKILESEFFTNDEAFKAAKRLTPDPAVKQRFESALNRAEQLTKAALGRNANDKNALFANILRLGLRADYLALIEKRYLTSLTEMKNSRGVAEQLVAGDPNYYDAYLAIGVENYMLSLKPAPLRWVLRLGGAQTDKDLGIQKLRLTAEKGRYLQPFARLLLAVAALRDKNRDQARQLLQGLAREFPQNKLYAQELARLH
jgi:hypothetical protein